MQHQSAPVLGRSPFASSYSGYFQPPFKENDLMGRLDYSLDQDRSSLRPLHLLRQLAFATFFPSSFQVYDNKDYTRNEVVGLDFNTGSFSHTIRFSYLKFQNQIVDGTRGQSLRRLANYPRQPRDRSFTSARTCWRRKALRKPTIRSKYDGSKVFGKHILRYGACWNHIQGGGFAKLFRYRIRYLYRRLLSAGA